VLARARAADDAAVSASATSSSAGDPELDQHADRTIKALNLRLQAAVLLDDGEPAKTAAEHLALLYPEGLAFTKSSYAAQDAVMQRMVRQLKSSELATSVEALAGKKYVTAFKAIAKTYHTMVKAMGRVVQTTVDQRGVLIDMQTVLVQHASRILGELDDADPKSVQRTRALLAPIDNFRARTSHGSSTPKTTPATEITDDGVDADDENADEDADADAET
jgi:hypothetical protein